MTCPRLIAIGVENAPTLRDRDTRTEEQTARVRSWSSMQISTLLAQQNNKQSAYSQTFNVHLTHCVRLLNDVN